MAYEVILSHRQIGRKSCREGDRAAPFYIQRTAATDNWERFERLFKTLAVQNVVRGSIAPIQ